MLLSAIFRKNIKNLSDLEVVQQISTNREAAMGEIYRRYAALVMGLCLKYMKQSDEAEDQMIQIFEKLEGKLAKHEVKHFKSWLYTVSRNACLMELRKKKHFKVEASKVLDHTIDDSDEKMQALINKELQLDELESALPLLKDDQRKAVELFYLKNKCYNEISTMMKVDVKKVKSLIQNGKRNLKLKLEKRL